MVHCTPFRVSIGMWIFFVSLLGFFKYFVFFVFPFVNFLFFLHFFGFLFFLVTVFSPLGVKKPHQKLAAGRVTSLQCWRVDAHQGLA